MGREEATAFHEADMRTELAATKDWAALVVADARCAVEPLV